jgi:hypothetical protein
MPKEPPWHVTIHSRIQEEDFMQPFIEMTISPQGDATIVTKGYLGSDCLRASKFLEEALGATTSEQKSTEFYEFPQVEQPVQQ